MRKLLFVSGLAAAAVMGVACSHTVEISGERGSGAVRAQKYESTSPEIEVISEDRGFMARRLVRIVLVKEEFVNGFLRLHLGFQSRSNKPVPMQYKVTFFDERGFPLEKFDVGWFPVVTDPRSMQYQQVMAQTKDARTYKIHVRRLDQ